MVGGTQQLKVDVRVIAATNKNLLDLVRRQLFREDLYFRVNVIAIDIPPLRERGDDVILLARHFVLKYSDDLCLSKNALSFHDLSRWGPRLGGNPIFVI